MHTCDFPFTKVVYSSSGLGQSKRIDKICANPITIKYSGQSDGMSWVGYRCDEHSDLAEHLTIEKISLTTS